MDRVRIAVIGCGYWGPNLLRVLLDVPEVDVVALVDQDRARLEHFQARHPQIGLVTQDHRDLFDGRVDAVVVATPPETHFPIVSDCLQHGLDVLVEKPLATTSEQAMRLVDLAHEYDQVLMVGHTFIYNPAVRALRDVIVGGELGDIRYIDSVRVSLGLFHHSLNTVWDLAPHDISIFMYLLGETPRSVSTRGVACVQESVEDVAYMTLSFPSGVLAHSRMSWLDPCKTRRTTVVGSEKMAVYDDLESHEKIRIYDKRVDSIRQTDTFGDFQFAYHYGSVVSPYIYFEEPLQLECRHFVSCIQDRSTPITDGVNGLEVVRVIEAAQRSLRSSGRTFPVGLEPVDAPASVSSILDGAGELVVTAAEADGRADA